VLDPDDDVKSSDRCNIGSTISFLNRSKNISVAVVDAACVWMTIGTSDFVTAEDSDTDALDDERRGRKKRPADETTSNV
jgi:hypothetical protein